MTTITATMPQPAAAAPVSAGERLHALDSLRASAMLLGIVLHAAIPFVTIYIDWPAHDVMANRGFDGLVGFIHGFRMQVFFFLAGFFGHLVWKRMGTRGFLAQRGVRIGLPFVAGMLLIIPSILLIWAWADSYLGTTFIRDHQAEQSLLAFPTAHLWFLEMLLLLYALAMVLAPLRHRPWVQSQLPRIDAAFDALLRHPLKPVILMVPTAALLWFGPRVPEIDLPGMRLLPSAGAVAYYALFFGIGWWMHRRVHLVDELRRWLWPYFGASFVCWLALGTSMGALASPGAAGHATAFKAAAIGSVALYSWFMTFAVTGLFLRVAGGHRPWMRYMADASYWWYLWHVPIVMVVQVWVARSPVNGWLKLLFIVAVAVAVLAPTYHWLVRYTWVGRILNGPRERPRAPAA